MSGQQCAPVQEGRSMARKPEGTIVSYSDEGESYSTTLFDLSGGILETVEYDSFNQETRNSLVSDSVGEWIYFTKRDADYDLDLIRSLLELDLDIVSPLVCENASPWRPLAYSRIDESQTHIPIDLSSSDRGIKEVVAVSMVSALIRRRVFDEMEAPYFEEGLMGNNIIPEDLYFCHKARKLGFKVHIDLSKSISRKAQYFSSIVLDSNDRWHTKIEFGENMSIGIPTVV